MIDVSGNRIAFTYDRDGGQLYLTRVDYNQRAGAANNSVEIAYEGRADALTDFRAGFGITTGRRVKRITMRASGAQVRRYELAYEAPSPTSVMSRLASVTMFGTDDKTSLPTISFTYSGFDPARQQVQVRWRIRPRSRSRRSQHRARRLRRRRAARPGSHGSRPARGRDQWRRAGGPARRFHRIRPCSSRPRAPSSPT